MNIRDMGVPLSALLLCVSAATSAMCASTRLAIPACPLAAACISGDQPRMSARSAINVAVPGGVTLPANENNDDRNEGVAGAGRVMDGDNEARSCASSNFTTAF